MTFRNESMVVFGAGSGIGAAVAAEASRHGARVVLVGRTAAKLARVAGGLPGAESVVADATDAASVEKVFAGRPGGVDHVVVCVSGGKGAGPFAQLDLADVRAAFEAKTMAQLVVAQVAARHLKRSLTFVTAGSARSRIRGTVGLAAVNGALEAAIPILALELAPVRVNGVSPGVIDTEWWDAMPADKKQAFFDGAAAQLPVGRVGRPGEVASLIVELAGNGFVTGSIFEVDGGSHLVTQ